jgi:hypothetical protein
MDSGSGVLEFEASDSSKIEAVQVILDPGGRQIFIAKSVDGNMRYRFQLKGNESGIGRNIVKALVVSDDLGWATVLQLNSAKGFYTEFAAASEDEEGRLRNRPDIAAMSYWRSATP